MNRILVVEDDTSISNVIEISLRNAGYLFGFRTAGTGGIRSGARRYYVAGARWIFPDGIF